MTQILIGGDRHKGHQVAHWLDTWGLQSAWLGPDDHPATVASDRARAVIYACDPDHRPTPAAAIGRQTAAPLLLVGPSPDEALAAAAWSRIPDPGPDGAALAMALRPCLEVSEVMAAGCTGFRDFLNHELRTPLTAAGTALQTLAMQLERAGGRSLELVDIAMRNIRRLEQTVDWASEYLAEDIGDGESGAEAPVSLTDLLEDLDDLESDLSLTWATGAGEWDTRVQLARGSWTRMLRQVTRALTHMEPEQPVHLDLDTLTSEDGETTSGLLLVFSLRCDADTSRVQRTGTQDEREQLRRLLSFTVSPELARRLALRYDVVRMTDHLRLRVFVPVTCPEGDLLPA